MVVCLQGILFFLIDSQDKLTLHLKDIGMEFSWPIKKIIEALPHTVNTTTTSPTPCSSETIEIITTLVEQHSLPESKFEIASGIVAFLWLYTSIQG